MVVKFSVSQPTNPSRFKSRLKTILEFPAISVSQASRSYVASTISFVNVINQRLVKYCVNTPDYLIPSVWPLLKKEKEVTYGKATLLSKDCQIL